VVDASRALLSLRYSARMTGARARVRAELTREIVDVARRHLASQGAAGLSLRAVARELGMASSAVYRYFPSRDELLTALIVEAYDALGEAAERADAACAPDDLRGRWHAVCRAAREWALAHPHEYGLLYGSPVPGYAAPQATIGPASRVGLALSAIVARGVATGAVDAGPGGPDASLHPGIAPRMGLPEHADGSLASRAILAWTTLFGLIGFELFGHTTNVVDDRDDYFDWSVAELAALVGLGGGSARSERSPQP
jgi:AcrR family transcriptional regulator